MLAYWKALALGTSGRGQSQPRNETTLPPWTNTYPVIQSFDRVNALVAARKSEFVRALRDYDRAAQNSGKLDTRDRLTYESSRLIQADRALHAVTQALYQQVKKGSVDMNALEPQFGSKPPLN
jgi:hypothetical protein